VGSGRGVSFTWLEEQLTGQRHLEKICEGNVAILNFASFLFGSDQHTEIQIGSWVIPVYLIDERTQRSHVVLPIYERRIPNHHPRPLSIH
jgi:hypothetical protein